MKLDQPITFDKFVRLLLVIAISIGIIYFIGRISDVLIPFVTAFIIAYLFNPLVDFFQKKLRFRIIGVFLTLLILIAIISLLIIIIVPLAIQEINHLGVLLNSLVNENDLEGKFGENTLESIERFIEREDVQAFFAGENFNDFLKMAAQKILPGIWGIISGTATVISGIIGLSIVGLYLFFLMLDFNKISVGWKELLPPKIKTGVIDFVDEFKKIMNSYFRGQALVAGSVGILFAIGFTIISLPMGILIGLFIGLLNMVPYLQIIGFLPATFAALLYSLETGNSFVLMMVFVVIVFGVVQTIQDFVLVPKIMGKVTGFNPAMILLFISIWGKLLGILGLLVALPLTYLILTYYRKFLSKRAMTYTPENNDNQL